LTAWFKKISANPKFVKIFGNIKLAEKSLYALPEEKINEAAPAKKDDDMDDLFGDDDNDAEAAKAAAAAAKA
jgi:hypothetical protein